MSYSIISKFIIFFASLTLLSITNCKTEVKVKQDDSVLKEAPDPILKDVLRAYLRGRFLNLRGEHDYVKNDDEYVAIERIEIGKFNQSGNYWPARTIINQHWWVKIYKEPEPRYQTIEVYCKIRKNEFDEWVVTDVQLNVKPHRGYNY